jgi:hypothetical protein
MDAAGAASNGYKQAFDRLLRDLKSDGMSGPGLLR